MRSSFASAIIASFFFLGVLAEVAPNAPSPQEVFLEGANCTTGWVGDYASPTTWKAMNIQLMTGHNFNMTHLSTVATGVDGTINGTFTFKCPQVTLNSAVYFYQYSTPLAPKNLTWTGRFAIAAPDGKVTPPPNATQPISGAAIPWGLGTLKNASDAGPPPSYLVAAVSNNTAPPREPSSATWAASQAGLTALAGSVALVLAGLV